MISLSNIFEIYSIDNSNNELNNDTIKKYQKWITNNIPFEVNEKDSLYYCNLMKDKFKELKLKNKNNEYWLETKNGTVINPTKDK